MMTIDEINDYLYHRQGYEDIKGAIHTCMYVCMLHGCSNVCIIYYPVPYIKSKNDRNVQKKGINCMKYEVVIFVQCLPLLLRLNSVAQHSLLST